MSQPINKGERQPTHLGYANTAFTDGKTSNHDSYAQNRDQNNLESEQKHLTKEIHVSSEADTKKSALDLDLGEKKIDKIQVHAPTASTNIILREKNENVKGIKSNARNSRQKRRTNNSRNLESNLNLDFSDYSRTDSYRYAVDLTQNNRQKHFPWINPGFIEDESLAPVAENQNEINKSSGVATVAMSYDPMSLSVSEPFLDNKKETKDDSENSIKNGRIPCKSEDPENLSEEHKDGVPERETWGKKLDFLLSVIGFAVDLGNVWRFPYICYKNGGGAFLIPYLIMLVLLGLPLFYMELALGQFHRSGAIDIWFKICPMFTGIGFGICFIATFVSMYYNTIIAYAVFYLFASFRSQLPWSTCGNDWNTPNCVSTGRGFNASQLTNESMLAASEYYQFHVLEFDKSNGIGDVGPPKWDILLCLLSVFVMIYFCLWKGIKSSGKAVWVTATLPYITLIILLVRGCTLPGSLNGIIYFIRPRWDRLNDVTVWLDAAAQIFFSLGPGFGTLIALSSYNKFNNNCYFDALVTSTINCLTSLLAGFVVFSILGYMAFVQGKDVENVAVEGPGLVFMVYPEVIASLDGSVFWSIVFFLMLITLGLDSTFGGLEAVITAVCDHWNIKRFRWGREIFVLCLVSYGFLGAMPTTTYGGQYVITLLDAHAAPIAILLICFTEAIAVNWFYGVNKFSKDIKLMIGFEPGIFWKVCWVFVCPLCLMTLFVLSVWSYKPLSLDGYVFPSWSIAIGWSITCLPLACIPIFMLFLFFNLKGTFKERLYQMTKPTKVVGISSHSNGSAVKDYEFMKLEVADLTGTETTSTPKLQSVQINGQKLTHHIECED